MTQEEAEKRLKVVDERIQYHYRMQSTRRRGRTHNSTRSADNRRLHKLLDERRQLSELIGHSK